MRLTCAGVLVGLLTACAGAPPAAEHPPNPAGEPEPALSPEPEPVLAPAAPIIPPPPAKCDVLRAAVPANTCPTEPLNAVESKLTTPTGLLAWEACEAFEPGLLRALVAELSPMECADVVVESPGQRPGRALSPELRDVLAGLGIAARLARLAGDPPRLEPPFDKPRFKDFLATRLGPWIVAQAKAIDELSRGGAGLNGYGKGVVAIQAGLADLRMVELMRETSLPDDMAGDKELEDVYYGALDQSLDPRKQRGRDAALVGLRRFHTVGAIADARLDQAHRLLSLLYNGRRIDGLAGLMLPAEVAKSPTDGRLANSVPTYYAGKLASPEQLRALVPALSHHGLPVPLQEAVEAPGSKPLSAESQLSYALGLARLGQRYFSRADFERAGKLAQPLQKQAKVAQPAKLLAALGKAFAGAPDDAAKMMIAGMGGWKPDTQDLDALAKGRDQTAGLAGFNAAFLLQLAAPPNSSAEYFADVSARFARAAKLLKGDQRQRAEDLADAADKLAKAVQP